MSSSTSGTASSSMSMSAASSTATSPPTAALPVGLGSTSAVLPSAARLSGSAEDGSSMRRHSRHHNELHRRKRTDDTSDAQLAENLLVIQALEDVASAPMIPSDSSESASSPNGSASQQQQQQRPLGVTSPNSISTPPQVPRRPSAGGSGDSSGASSKLIARPVMPLRPEVLANAGMRPLSPPRPEAGAAEAGQSQGQGQPPHAGEEDATMASSLSTNFMSDASLGPNLQSTASLEMRNMSMSELDRDRPLLRSASLDVGDSGGGSMLPPQGPGMGNSATSTNSNAYSAHWLSRSNSMNISRVGSNGGGGGGSALGVGSYDLTDSDMRALLEDGLVSPIPGDKGPRSDVNMAMAMSPRRYALQRNAAQSNNNSNYNPYSTHDYVLNSSLSFGGGHGLLSSNSGGSMDMSEGGGNNHGPMLVRSSSNASSVGARQQLLYMGGSSGNVMGNVMSSEWGELPLVGRQGSGSNLGSFSADAMQAFEESLDVPSHGVGGISGSGSGEWAASGQVQQQRLQMQQHLQQQQQQQQQYYSTNGGGVAAGMRFASPQQRAQHLQSLAGSVRNLSIERRSPAQPSISDTGKYADTERLYI